MATGSIFSFPERGPWGGPGYRGNCSGYMYRDIFRRLRPRVFTDPMVGGGMSMEGRARGGDSLVENISCALPQLLCRRQQALLCQLLGAS
jgi:hypothetical protein